MANNSEFYIGVSVGVDGIDTSSIEQAKKVVKSKFEGMTFDLTSKDGIKQAKTDLKTLLIYANEFQKSYNKAISAGADDLAADYGQVLEVIRAKIKEVNDMASQMGVKISNATTTKLGKQFNANKIKQESSEAVRAINDIKDAHKDYQRAVEDSTDANENYQVEVEDSTDAHRNYQRAVEDSTEETSAFNNEVGEASTGTTKLSGVTGELSKRFLSFVSVANLVDMAIQAVTDIIREAIDTIFELNKAMTDVQMVTGETQEQIFQRFDDYNELAKELSVTTVDVAEGASEWFNYRPL